MLAHRRSVWLCLLLLVLAGGLPASSQVAVLSGTVSDESGAVLPGVTVTVSSPSRPDKVLVTDAQGRFRMFMLEPGSYTARFELAGFRVHTETFEAQVGRPITLTVTLGVGSVAETVTVTSQAPTVQTSRTYTSSQAIAYPRHARSALDGERYRHFADNGFQRVSAHPLSTFSIDADTASYANVRRMISDGMRPPEGAVRIEELINYFAFDYPAPPEGTPVAVTTELARCPWNERRWLALVGIRAADRPRERPSGRNFVFLVDVSGSMQSPDKLQLVKQSLRLLADDLTERDRVAIVVYAGASGLALPSTPGHERRTILGAIDRLEAGGSTNGAAGIQLAYHVARQQFMPDGVNRVILATDGDFNVGVTSHDELVRLIERERKSGVFLSVLGVGTGNLQDMTMELLADKGDGNYSYLDSIDEARKVLVRESGATLVTVAKDVKIQIEFNPQLVEAYRLIGYENRVLDAEDFNDDEKDAGEIGAGDAVTALYEIVPKGESWRGARVDALKYQRAPEPSRDGRGDEVMTVKLRYKLPDEMRSQRIETAVVREVRPLEGNLGFASAVAEFGMVLRRSPHAGKSSFDAALARAQQFRGDDPTGDRRGFADLVQRAIELLEHSNRSRSSQQ
jgi:Ca-activated chloride channel family protein